MALLSMVNAGDTGSPEFDAAIGVAGQDFSQPEQFDIGTLISSTTAAIAPGYQQYDDQMRSVDTVARESGGVAPSLGSNWISEMFGNALKWYEKQGDMTKGGINTMAGSFIKGLFSYNDEQRKIKALEKSSEANMMNAQTNASTADRKFSNASAIGQTNFGAAQPQGLIFRNKLAPRQTRAGYGG